VGNKEKIQVDSLTLLGGHRRKVSNGQCKKNSKQLGCVAKGLDIVILIGDTDLLEKGREGGKIETRKPHLTHSGGKDGGKKRIL